MNINEEMNEGINEWNGENLFCLLNIAEMNKFHLIQLSFPHFFTKIHKNYVGLHIQNKKPQFTYMTAGNIQRYILIR